MMADHWKSIANLLGAPGVDEPEVDTQAAEPAPKAVPKAVPPSPAKPSRPSTSASAVTVDDKALSSSESDAFGGASKPTPEPPAANPNEFVFDPNTPIPDELLSFKPPRPKPTRSETQQPEPRSTSTTPPAARSFSEPAPPSAAEARREAPSMPDRFEPETPVATPAAAEAPRRKSSWESLANMFNIKVDRSKPVEAAKEIAAKEPRSSESRPSESRPSEPRTTETRSSESRSARPARPPADDDQQLSIFSGESSRRSNPALDAMFGDTPPGGAKSRSDEWGKPRVIDDLGWDDDEAKVVGKGDEFAESDEPRGDVSTRSNQGTVRPESNAEGDDEEAPRRGRRRRRGRRGRGDAAGPASGPADDRPIAPRAASWGGLDDAIEDEVEVDSGDDRWDEPQSFEEVVPSGASDELDEDLDGGADEISAEGEVLRRSSRRRRRGRGRGARDREPADATDEAPAPRPSSGRGRSAPAPRTTDSRSEPVGFEPVGFIPESDADDFGDSPELLDAPRPAASPRRGDGRNEGRDAGRESDDRGSRPRRGRRGGSSSEKGPDTRRETAAGGRGRAGEARVAGRPSDDEGPIDEDFDDISLGPDFDGEEDGVSGDGKHRSIPTWADSIQTLVDSNMENRKRGDNRGSAPRGRPRGRR